MATQSQLNNLTEIFSDFLEFTHKKSKFMEYLENKTKKAKSKSVENPEILHQRTGDEVIQD